MELEPGLAELFNSGELTLVPVNHLHSSACNAEACAKKHGWQLKIKLPSYGEALDTWSQKNLQ